MGRARASRATRPGATARWAQPSPASRIPVADRATPDPAVGSPGDRPGPGSDARSTARSPAVATSASPTWSSFRRGLPSERPVAGLGTRRAGRAVAASSASRRSWTHQRTAAEHAHAGRSVVLATGTGSGKSLAFQLPALTAVLAGRAAVDGRGATVLYLAPTKALAADQARALRELDVPGVRVGAYDGDTPMEERDWVRRFAAYVLTNPDMLHAGILPGHARWAPFLQVAAVRRDRRGTRLPRGVRCARRPGDPSAPPDLRLVRERPGLRARLGDDRRTRRRPPSAWSASPSSR